MGGLGWLKVGEQAPLFALLGAVGYGVALIPTRADATGRLFDLAAHTAVVFALVESALAWLEAEESGELAKVLGGVLAVLAVTMLALITWVARPSRRPRRPPEERKHPVLSTVPIRSVRRSLRDRSAGSLMFSPPWGINCRRLVRPCQMGVWGGPQA